MNILYIAHRIPYPPDKGDKIRSFNTLRLLARKHDVWCACFVDDPPDWKYVPTLRTYCRDVIALPLRQSRKLVGAARRLVDGGALSEGFYHDPAMFDALDGLARQAQFDAVLVFSSSMGQYGLRVDAGRHVIDLCDLDSAKWAECARRRRAPLSWVYSVEAERLRALEARLIRSYDASLLIGAHEAEAEVTVDRSRLHFVPNGVALPDLDWDGSHDSGIVGFVGDMRYWPNEDAVCWFAREVWPAVVRAVPGAQFRIVGRGPSRATRRLGRLPGVEVTGAVDDVSEELRRFQVSVAPLRVARGIQNKVLEAMAMGRTVVATPGAASGIHAKDGEHWYVPPDRKQFGERLIYLLGRPDECRRLGHAARRYVEESYRWDAIGEKLEALLGGNCASAGTKRTQSHRARLNTLTHSV